MNQKGQGLIEYLIIVAIMAIATMGVMRVVGQNLTSRFANVALVLQGKEGTARYEQVMKSHYKKKDFSDFFKGASSADKE